MLIFERCFTDPFDYCFYLVEVRKQRAETVLEVARDSTSEGGSISKYIFDCKISY